MINEDLTPPDDPEDPLTRLLALKKAKPTAPADDTTVAADDPLARLMALKKPQPKAPTPPPGNRPGVLSSALAGAAEGVPFLNRALAQGTRLFGANPDSALADIGRQQTAAKAAHPTAYGTGKFAGEMGALTGATALGGPVLGSAAFGAAKGADTNGSVVERGVSAAKDAGLYALGGKVGEMVVQKPLEWGTSKVAQLIADRTANQAVKDAALKAALATGKNKDILQSIPNPKGLATQAEASAPAELVGRGLPTQEAAGRTLAGSGNRMFPAAYETPGTPTASTILPPKLQQMVDQYASAGHSPEQVQTMTDRLTSLNPGIAPPDAETVHAMRKAAVRAGDWGKVGEIDQLIDQAHPALKAAIQDYAKNYRVHDLLEDANHIEQYLSPTSKAVPPRALTDGDPGVIASSLEGIRGVARQMENMSPAEQQAYRAFAQERLAKVGPNALKHVDASPEWQTLLFGSPDTYNAWRLGQSAGPQTTTALQRFASGATHGWVPFGWHGVASKIAQGALGAAGRGSEGLIAPGPMAIGDVLQQAEHAQAGRPLARAIEALRNGVVISNLPGQ